MNANVIEFNSEEQKKWLKDHKIETEAWNTLCKNLYPQNTPAEVKMVWDYCKVNNLDPLKKPVHLVPMLVEVGRDEFGNAKKEWRTQVMMGIVAWRTIAHRTNEYAGVDACEYGEEIEHLGVNVPEYCRHTVYRIVKGQRCAFVGPKVYFKEICGTKNHGTKTAPNYQLNYMWSNRPRGQLEKCSEAAALRVAFPEQFGSEYIPEEMHERVIESDDWKPTFSDEQFHKLCELINNGESVELYAFIKSLNIKEHTDMLGAYYKRAPKGQKTQYSETVKELLKDGEHKIENAILDMQSALETGDDAMIEEILQESSPTLEAMYRERLGI